MRNNSLKRFRAVSLLTIFTLLSYFVVGMLVLLPAKAAAISSVQDLMTRLQVSTLSSHDILFTMDAGTAFAAGEQIAYDFNEDGSGFAVNGASSVIGDFDFNDGSERTVFSVGTGAPNCTGASTNDVAIGINDTTGVVTVELCTGATASASGATVNLEYGVAATGPGTNRVTNPAAAGSYEIGIAGTFGDSGNAEVSIVDDDTVNVTGFIDTYITFDIDTDESDTQCDAAGGGDPCDSHSGSTDNAGYVVDLGEMTTSNVSNSGDTGVLHQDGNTGTVNYIWFDLSTNASAGAIVTILSPVGVNDVDGTPSSALSALEHTTLTDEIRSVTAEQVIAAGSGLYGVARGADLGGDGWSSTAGTVTFAANYDLDTASEYGYVPAGAGTGTPSTVFSTAAALDTGRIEMQVAASPDSLDSTGTYTDQLTFIATATF